MAEDSSGVRSRSGLAGKLIIFVLGCCISLAVGKVFEFMTTANTYRSALELQQRWYNSIDALTPWTLATNYLGDVTAFALRGETNWSSADGSSSGKQQTERPENLADHAVHCEALKEEPNAKPVSVPAKTAADSNTVELTTATRDATCRYLNGKASRPCLPGIGQVECTAEGECSSANPGVADCIAESGAARKQFDEQCEGWVEQQFGLSPAESNRMLQDLGRQQTGGNSSSLGQKLIAPLVGIAAAWTRLTHEGGSSYFWAILQLVAGFVGFLVICAWLEEGGSEGVWFWLVGVPIGTVVTASVLAFAVKYVMLGALFGFGWFTCFAGLCCGAVGVAGFIWSCIVNLAEHGVQNAVAPK